MTNNTNTDISSTWLPPERGRGSDASSADNSSNDASNRIGSGRSTPLSQPTSNEHRERDILAHNQTNPPPRRRHDNIIIDHTQSQQIKKNTRANIKVATLNMQGRGATSVFDPNNKWLKINQIMKENKLSILALQETHLPDEMRSQLENLHQHLKIFSSSHPERPNAMGVAIVLNKRLLPTNEASAQTLIDGRALMASVPWHNNETLKILNVYAPNDARENTNFWKDLDNLWSNPDSQLHFPDIMMGDFNMCENSIDRINLRIEERRITDAFNDLKLTLGLQDGWRHVFPNDTLFTLTHRANNGHLSRLDRIYLTQDLLNRTENWEHTQPPITSDHKIVSTTILKPNFPYIGKGRWQIPPHVLLNHTFIQTAERIGIEMLNEIRTLEEVPNNRTETYNAQTKAEEYKREILKEAIKLAKKPIHPIEKRLKELDLKIKTISNDLTIELNEKTLSLTLLEMERHEVTAKSFMAKRLKMNAKNRLEGETISKYWVNTNKPKKPRDTILRLKIIYSDQTHTNNPTYITKSDEMANLAAKYHTDIQSKDLDVNEEQRAQAILKAKDSISNRLDENQIRKLNREINKLDVEIALSSAANNKAPGLDGIPYEFWKIMKERHTTMTKFEEPAFDVITFLQLLFNDIERHNLELQSKFNDGWMCPIFKKGDKADIANYRPITVLNTDYKLITKSLQAKLAQAAPDLIHDDQAGFMKNRSITDHIKTIRIISEYSEISEELNGATIALDQEKAYDRIRHDYLWEVMNEMRIPKHFIDTTKNLYRNAKTKVMINGVLSEYFTVTRGVRQGDPLSCLLFNLAIEPLANLIRNSDIEGIDIPRTKRKLKVLLFADDTTIFLKHTDSFTTLNQLLDSWCLASGAKFNKNKTEIIPRGNEEYKEKLRETRRLSDRDSQIPIDAHILDKNQVVRILGASVGDNKRDDVPWTKVTDKVTTNLAQWNKSNPTIEGRRLSAQMIIGGTTQFLAKAQGMPEQVESTFEKIIKKYIWNAERAKIGIERLSLPHEIGGRKVLNIKQRNQAIAATNIKTYLRTDEQKPAWTYFYDEFIRRAYEKNFTKHKDDDPRINPVVQAWPPPNNMKSLPKEVKDLVKNIKKLNVTLDGENASNEAKRQIPIWLHPKLANNAKQDTYSKKSIHLRKIHNTKTVGDTINIAKILLNPDHNNHQNCECPGCHEICLNSECTTPSICATHAKKLINKIDHRWLPGGPASPPTSPANPHLINTPQNLYECFRILTDNQEPLESQPATLTNARIQRILTIYTDGSCDKNGDEKAKAGSGIFYNHNDHRNMALRVPQIYSQTNQTGELYAIKAAIETSDPNDIIEIRTDSQYSIDALTKHFKKWENSGWVGIQNKELIKDTLNTLRAHKAPIKLTWIKGHAGHEGNEMADHLAKQGTQREQIYGPNTHTRNTIPPGAKLTDITQALIYKELNNRKTPPKENSTTQNVERIQQDLQISQDYTPPKSAIWLSLQKTRNVYRTQREFIYKAIKNAHMVGERWKHIPNYEDRAVCTDCNATENLEHILTRCNVPGQDTAWQTMCELWGKKYPGEGERPSYGEILGITSVIKTTNGKYNKAKTRLYQILVSEIAYIIWTLRCTRIIEHNNEKTKWPKRNQIRNLIKHKLDMRLRMDCLHTSTKSFKAKALRQSIVRKTWAGLLENEEELPTDWPRKAGVLVGISLIPPNDYG